MTKSTVINGRRFADGRNSSYLPFGAGFQGQEVWSVETALIDDPLPPEQLAIVGSDLVLKYGCTINVRTQADGASRWLHDTRANFAFQATEDGLVTLNQAGFLEMLGMDQSPGTPLSLPFLSDQTFLFFSTRVEDEMRYAYSILPQPTSAPGDPSFGPSFRYSRYQVSSQDFLWELRGEGELRDVLYHEGENRICLATAEKLLVLPADAAADDAVVSIELEEILWASLDNEGNVLCVHRTEEELRLSRFGADGAVMWELVLADISNVVQPPATTPAGVIYLLSPQTLFRIKDGQIEWSAMIPSPEGRPMMTVIADESVLLAAGSTLIQILADGKTGRSLNFAEPVTCRPVVDETSKVYVGTKSRIICLK